MCFFTRATDFAPKGGLRVIYNNTFWSSPWPVTQSRNSIVYFSYLKKAVIRWFFARDSSLVLPSYQPCLCLMGTVKYRTSDQREEMSKIPEVRGFSACIDSIADAVQELCYYAFSFVYIFGRKSLKPFSPSAKVLSRLRNDFLCVASWTCGTWWIYLLVEIQFRGTQSVRNIVSWTTSQSSQWGHITIKTYRKALAPSNLKEVRSLSCLTWCAQTPFLPSLIIHGPLQQFLKLVLCYCLPAELTEHLRVNVSKNQRKITKSWTW